MNYPKPVTDLIDDFNALPGIGKKTAERLVFYLLNKNYDFFENFSTHLKDLKLKLKKCKQCHNLTTNDLCDICENPERDKSMLCIVSAVTDLYVLEETNAYNGLYYVLYGEISTLKNKFAKDLDFESLLLYVHTNKDKLREIVFATNATISGETTARYIKQLLIGNNKITFSRLAIGLPTGAQVEYADEATLKKAISFRQDF